MIRVLRSSEGGEISSGISDEVVSRADERWIWVDLVAETGETTARQASELGIDETIVAQLSEGRTSTGLEEHPDLVHMTLTGFVTGQGERMITSEVNALISDSFLVTIHERESPYLDSVFEHMTGEIPFLGVGPAGLLGYAALLANRQLGPLLDELEEQADALEELAFAADPRTVTDAHALRRDAILLRRSLRSQHRVFRDLTASEYPMINDRDRRVFDRVTAAQSDSIDSLEASLHLLGSVIEAFRSAIADQTNEIVRVLTVFSAVMLPLGLLAGIWGMNFDRIPAYALPWGFWIPIGMMVLIASGLWVYFSHRGFVGAPRLRELPKSVGLGVLKVGSAATRVVASGVDLTMQGRRAVAQKDSDE